MNTLLTASFAADDRDGAFGNVEGVCDDFDELGVGRPIHRSCVEAHEQRLATHAGKA